MQISCNTLPEVLNACYILDALVHQGFIDIPTCASHHENDDDMIKVRHSKLGWVPKTVGWMKHFNATGDRQRILVCGSILVR